MGWTVAGQAAVQEIVGVVELVGCGALQEKRDECGVLRAEGDGDEFGVFALRVVQLLGDDVAFPGSPEAFAGRFPAPEPAQVGFGAGDEHEIGLLHLLFTPSRPAFFGRLLVLIDGAIDALAAQAVG